MLNMIVYLTESYMYKCITFSYVCVDYMNNFETGIKIMKPTTII